MLGRWVMPTSRCTRRDVERPVGLDAGGILPRSRPIATRRAGHRHPEMRHAFPASRGHGRRRLPARRRARCAGRGDRAAPCRHRTGAPRLLPCPGGGRPPAVHRVRRLLRLSPRRLDGDGRGGRPEHARCARAGRRDPRRGPRLGRRARRVRRRGDMVRVHRPGRVRVVQRPRRRRGRRDAMSGERRRLDGHGPVRQSVLLHHGQSDGDRRRHHAGDRDAHEPQRGARRRPPRRARRCTTPTST